MANFPAGKKLAEEFFGGDNGIGRRGVLLHRYGFVANAYENTRWLSFRRNRHDQPLRVAPRPGTLSVSSPACTELALENTKALVRGLADCRPADRPGSSNSAGMDRERRFRIAKGVHPCEWHMRLPCTPMSANMRSYVDSEAENGLVMQEANSSSCLCMSQLCVSGPRPVDWCPFGRLGF